MLRSVNDLQGLTIEVEDGEIGSVDTFLFDDEHWTVRYLVVNTGGWLFGRQVLISPISIGNVDWEGKRLHVHLTRQQLEYSPEIDMARPVSRQLERDYMRYYGWPAYWGGAGVWGGWMYPGMLLPPPGTEATHYEDEMDRVLAEKKGEEETRLRSTREVEGYAIQAIDGDMGHVEDFIIEDKTWSIRYLVVDTRNWWPGKKVLVPPQWISRVSWAGSLLNVDLTRGQIRNAPEWDPKKPITREYEERLFDYYGRTKYWEPPAAKRAA